MNRAEMNVLYADQCLKITQLESDYSELGWRAQDWFSALSKIGWQLHCIVEEADKSEQVTLKLAIKSQEELLDTVLMQIRNHVPDYVKERAERLEGRKARKARRQKRGLETTTGG